MNKLLIAVISTGLLSASTISNAASNESWQRIDFDADLTTYLISAQRISKQGDTATLWELDVPGRTSISTGAQNHTLVERLFDCTQSKQRIGQVLMFASLSAKAKSLPHDDISYQVQPGSIDEIEMKLACSGVQPESSVYTNQRYDSLEQSVLKAFGDAIKLPREQSNKTLKGLGGMGGPPANGANGPGPSNGPGGPANGPANAPRQ